MGYLSNWVMHCRRCWLAILTYIVICLSSKKMVVVGSSSNETDRLALLAFKSRITVDPFGIMRLWNDSIHICEWYGVTCGKRHPKVSQLKLNSLKLGGSISPHIGNLSFLRVLQLENNSFIRQIPPEIGRLKRLQVLDLRNNSLGGEIPVNLTRCSSLRFLKLTYNNLEKDIPSEVGLLSNLQYFGLSMNNLTGSIPPSLGNLTSLELLGVENNNLVGTIPLTLSNLNQLRFLSLGLNYLSGEVPSSLFNLTFLGLMDIGVNQLKGNLPPQLFFTLPNLYVFSVGKNQFTGPIPVSLSNASSLTILQLSQNRFTGNVPSLEILNLIRIITLFENQLGNGIGAEDDLNFICSLTNATALERLAIQVNNLGGKLPSCITNLSSELADLVMFGNFISGNIPLNIGNLIGLQVLSVAQNLFTGSIPPSIGSLENLVQIEFEGNNLTGLIPSSIGRLSQLNELDLSSNSLEGTIPSSLGNCTFLQTLNLGQNYLTGSIPPQILTIPSLSISLSVSQNQLTGFIPEEVGKLTNLYLLDFSANMLSGKIPESLGSCMSLQYLYLYGNKLQGPIPSSLSSMKGLQALDVANNNLSGQIPEFLAYFVDLTMLNLSFNNLEGAVPKTGVFRNSSATSLEGNNKLCGGILDFHLPKCTIFTKRTKWHLSAKSKVVIGIVAGFASVAILILLLFIFGSRRKQKETQEENVVSSSRNQPVQFVSYGDLHRTTNGFSEENLVGTGNFGHVYRGELGENGQVVAIKVLKLERMGANRTFIAECEALRNIRHRNLVKLLTVCSGLDYQGNEFKALIYEFMSNGSLEDWLHPTTTIEDKPTPRQLSLLKRLNIAIDVASLLEYVHHQFGTPLVHCDIKPSNILLDDDLSGHVSDFGLAKFLSDTGIIRSSADPSSSLGVRGTVGYAPPEYGLGSEVSTQGDVYSYGILLLEMFTGKRPTDEMFKEGLSLHLYAKTALRSTIVEVLDPYVKDCLESADHGRVMDCLVTVIEIGVSCSLESPLERMDMRKVSTKLRKVQEKLLTRRN